MKIVIPGGSGQVGTIVSRELVARGHEVVILSRRNNGAIVFGARAVPWDGRTLGDWVDEIDGADAVLNLAGRSVDCRYTVDNLRAMMDSRVYSTRIVGEAIASVARPPATWLQMSTATIYSHRFDAENDERTGILGGDEPDAPAYWRYSIDIAKAWERTLGEARTPNTRKVALRTAMVMSPDRGGPFDVLLRLTRFGLGGNIGAGTQYMSWIHEVDFVRALSFILERSELEGPVNIAAPAPARQSDFMLALRESWGCRVGIPTTHWMLQLGAFILRTDPELVLKSRRVTPGRLQSTGFTFLFSDWNAAARDLVERWRSKQTDSEPRRNVA
jgi:uncharacterized protein (TIGR01777 family)